MKRTLPCRLAFAALLLAFAPAALASTTWYVDGVNGVDTNDCISAQTACKTIGHSIALAHWGDSIIVAPATYTENLTISKSVKILGSDAATTIVDGNQAGTVFTISNSKAYVTLSNLTIQNGLTSGDGGGVNNSGTLTIIKCTVSSNSATNDGGGIENNATLVLANSTVSRNTASNHGGGVSNHDGGKVTINKDVISGNSAGSGGGGGIHNRGTMTITRATISGNSAWTDQWGAEGGGIFNDGYYASSTLTINNTTISANTSSYYGGGIDNYGGTLFANNSTFTGNSASAYGGAISNWGMLTISNCTLSGNSAGVRPPGGGGIGNTTYGQAVMQNTIIANSSSAGGNCSTAYSAPVISNGYNLSSDDTCSFTGPGDMNNTDPKLGPLGSYGGPTQTIPLLKGSPAIDAGNPNGCTDSNGNLLKTDQRGWRRPDSEDNGVGCDIGAFERQIP